MTDEVDCKAASRRKWMVAGGVFVLLVVAGSLWWHFTYTTSWKEEVLLHNGRKIIIERSFKRDPFARREIGQPAMRVEESMRFTIPDTNQSVEWKSEIGVKLQDSLTLLMLDLMEGVPYIGTIPVRCHSFNKWGRPNPAYVFFKHDGNTWQRVALEDFPAEFKKANVMIGGYNPYQLSKAEKNASYLSAKTIKAQNSHMTPESRYMREFIRKPVTFGPASMASCEEMVFYKGGWIMPNGPAGRAAMDRKEEREKNKWYLRLWRALNGD